MHSGARKAWCLVLAAALLLTLSGGIFSTAWAGGMVVERELPDKVAPGQTFEVIITFEAPADNMHGIVLFDRAPAGWTVQVDKTWCTPEAFTHKIYAENEGEYAWLGPFNEGTAFEARYMVTVPVGAEKDTCDFPDGFLAYYIEPTPAPRYDVPITGDFQIEVAIYDLTIDSTEGGSVDTPGEGTFEGYEPGEVVDLVAVADECYEFTGWTGDTVNIDDPESATTTITMDDDYSITATFAKIEYDLTVGSTDGGSVTAPGEGTFPYDCGDEVDLVAVADECYEFTGWTGDTVNIDDPESATTTITMDDDYSVTATFAKIQYSLTVDSTAGGQVTVPGEGTFTYDCGDEVDLVAVADECYEFTGWTGGTGAIDDPESATTTTTMYDDHSVTATFAKIQYDLIVDSTDGGQVTVPGEGTFTYDCGDVVDMVAVADEGYLFDRWTGDIETIDDPFSAETFVTMSDAYSITAEFIEAAGVIHGRTWDVTCLNLAGVTVTLYSNGTPIASTVSDMDGNYELAVTELGVYTVVASKEGFRDETQGVDASAPGMHEIDFVGNHGLIPNEVDGTYFSACMSLYLFGEGDCALDGTAFGKIMSAYLNPIT